MQAEMVVDGFRVWKSWMEKWEESCLAREAVVTATMQRSNTVAAQPVRIAATVTGNPGRGMMGRADGDGQLSVFQKFEFQQSTTSCRRCLHVRGLPL
jgi:hypothetical protein